MYQPYKPSATVTRASRTGTDHSANTTAATGSPEYDCPTQSGRHNFNGERNGSGYGRHAAISQVSTHANIMSTEDIVPNGKTSSDNELFADLVEAALETGSKAFEAQEWHEAELVLQESVEMSRELPEEHRSTFDLFEVQGKLAICAYYTQEVIKAQQLLLDVTQHSSRNEKQQLQSASCSHLLSQSYLKMGQTERARLECEKALQARRRLLGKQCGVTLESMALMAHISGMLDNRARAKLYLAMIPEANRHAAVKAVETTLQMPITCDNSIVPLTPPLSENSDNFSWRQRDTLSDLPHVESNRKYPQKAVIVSSPRSTSSSIGHRQSIVSQAESVVSNVSKSNDIEVFPDRTLSPGGLIVAEAPLFSESLSRKDILGRVGCQPRDDIEEAVCHADQLTVERLLSKKKSSWKNRFRKRGPSERVTALHFAALFGDVDVARRLVEAEFNVNEVPYGYTSRLSPLHFAIGARQSAMVDFLLVNGAKPTQNETWSSLAGQLLNRSWLMKTMCGAEKGNTLSRMKTILTSLLKHGWTVNAPIDTTGRTVLHQAVSFCTGSFEWDVQVRCFITAFLCERGADALQANVDGQSAYDLAIASGHQDLLKIIQRHRDYPVDVAHPLVAELHS